MLPHRGYRFQLSALTWISFFTFVATATTDVCSYITNPNCSCLVTQPSSSSLSSSSATQADVTCSFSSRPLHPIISTTTSASISLQTLNLSYSGLEVIPPHFFQGIHTVHKLDLSGNAFTQIPGPALASLSGLKVLDLSNNLVTQMTMSRLASASGLVTLDLSGNRIKVLSGQSQAAEAKVGVLSLQMLNLSGNAIDSISADVFTPMRHLVTLDLSHNQLQEVTDAMFSWLGFSLNRLDLSHNCLTSIQPMSLRHLRHLRKLSLAHNPLQDEGQEEEEEEKGEVLTRVMFPLHLQSLDLSHCTLTIIDHCQLTSLPDLGFIELRGNDLRCSCQLYLLLEWYQNQHHKPDSLETSDVGSNWTCTDASEGSPHISTKTDNNNTTESNRVRLVRDLQWCADTQSHCPTMEHALSHHNGSSEMVVKLDVVSSGNTLMASWVFENNGQVPVDGFQLHYLPEDGQPLDSPLIPITARSFILQPLQLEKHFMVCLSVLAYQTTIMHQKCCNLKDESQNVISGVLAAVVFLTPCLAVLLYVVVKDSKIKKKWTYRQCSQEHIDVEKCDPEDGRMVDAESEACAHHTDSPPQSEHDVNPASKSKEHPRPNQTTLAHMHRDGNADDDKKSEGPASQTSEDPTTSARAHNSGKEDDAVYDNTMVSNPTHQTHKDQLHHELSTERQIPFTHQVHGATEDTTDADCKPDEDTMTKTQTSLETSSAGKQQSQEPVSGIDNPGFAQDQGSGCDDQSKSTRF